MQSPLPRKGTQEASSRVTEGAPPTLGKKGRTDRGGKTEEEREAEGREGRKQEELRKGKSGREERREG